MKRGAHWRALTALSFSRLGSWCARRGGIAWRLWCWAEDWSPFAYGKFIGFGGYARVLVSRWKNRSAEPTFDQKPKNKFMHVEIDE